MCEILLVDREAHDLIANATTLLLRLANAMLLHSQVDGMPEEYRRVTERLSREAADTAAKLRLLEIEN